MIENNKIFKEHLLNYDKTSANEFLATFTANTTGFDTINNLFFEVLTSIGNEWDEGKLSLSQVYMSGVLCEELINEIYKQVAVSDAEKSHIALVTFSDFHTLGRKILFSHLTLSGYKVKDFGKVAEVNSLVERCITENIKILLISVLMLPSALKIKDLRQEFINRNYEIILIAGGAPFIFNSELYKDVSADDTGRTPADAMKLIDKWSENVKPNRL